jgi:hypothetical protein
MGKSVSKLLKFPQLACRGSAPNPPPGLCPWTPIGQSSALAMHAVLHFSNRRCASATVPTANLYSMYGYVTQASWVMDQVSNGSHGSWSWVKLRDPSSTLISGGEIVDTVVLCNLHDVTQQMSGS